jgi:hypothetical protein
MFKVKGLTGAVAETLIRWFKTASPDGIFRFIDPYWVQTIILV